MRGVAFFCREFVLSENFTLQVVAGGRCTYIEVMQFPNFSIPSSNKSIFELHPLQEAALQEFAVAMPEVTEKLSRSLERQGRFFEVVSQIQALRFGFVYTIPIAFLFFLWALILYPMYFASLFLFRPTKFQWDLIIGFVVILLGGAWISASVGDWMWFQRSGALVVAFSIFLIAIDYPKHLARWLGTLAAYTLMMMILNGRIADGSSSWFERLCRLEFGVQGRTLKLIVDSKLDDHVRCFRKTVVWLTFLGTLVWGFGDLAGWLFV